MSRSFFFLLILIRSIFQFSLVSISVRKNRKSNDGLLRRFNDAKLRAYKANERWALASMAMCPLFVFRAFVFRTLFSSYQKYFSIFISVNFRKKEQKIQWRTPSKIQWREIEGIQSQWTLSFGINGCVSAVRVPSSCFPNLIFNNGLSSFRRCRCFF